MMTQLRSPHFWMGVALGSVLILGLLVYLASQAATRWIDSPGFVQMLDKEVSKGLKLDGHFGPMQRSGILGMTGTDFHGSQGQKTIVSMDAYSFTGWFNPLGVIFHRWQLEAVHIDAGTVWLQKTEATPGAKPKGMPWWGLFWPYRVQLQDIRVDHAKVLWKLSDKESGIYDTVLEVTPNGHDFEYDARGGVFTTPSSPAFQVQHIHLLVRRPRLYCNEMLLGDDPAHPEETLRVQGDAGLQKDHTIKASADLSSLNIEPWLPDSQRGHIQGHASGHMDYLSTGTGLDTASGNGHIHVDGGLLHHLAAIGQYAKVTGSPDPEDVPLNTCQTDVVIKDGAVSLQNIDVESTGIFHLTGRVEEAKDKSLSGSLEIGLTDAYLHWLPSAQTAIFDHRVGDYHFATVRVYGTAEKPEQDLTPRITHEVEKSPTTALKLFFNAAGSLFKSN